MLSKFSRVLPNIQKLVRNISVKKKKKKNGPLLLLHLSWLALEIVFNQLTPVELLNLSACSMACADAISIVSKCYFAESCIIHLRNPRPSITIKFQHSKQDLKWVFEKSEKLTRRHVVQDRILSGYHFSTYYVNSKPAEIMCRNEDVLESFPFILKHLLDIFTVPIQMVIEPNLGTLIGLFGNPIFTFCNDLELTRGYKMCYFPHNEVQKICEQVSVKETLNIGVDTNCRYLRHQIFSVENFSLENAIWMNPSDLFRLDCKVAKFRRHSFNQEDIESLAMKWLETPVRPKLERMEFGWDQFASFRLANMKTMRWDRNRRSRRCWRNTDIKSGDTIDCSGTFDIVRKDGLIASLGTVDSLGRCILIFHVWHDPFPTKTKQETLQKSLIDLYNEQGEINRLNGVGGLAETALTNPNLESTEFRTLLHDTYAHRIALFGESPELERWLDFHVRILNVKKDIELYL